MNEVRCNPGVYVSPDKGKMYVFTGFVEPLSKTTITTPLTHTVEFLDLKKKNAQWQYVSIDQKDQPLERASYVMFPFSKLQG